MSVEFHALSGHMTLEQPLPAVEKATLISVLKHCIFSYLLLIMAAKLHFF